MSFIGVIDSGVGGLTILRQLQQRNPHNYCYVADHAFCPYGTKPNDTVFDRTNKLVDYLQLHGAQAVVLACNTMSAYAEQLRARFNVPIYDVITHTCNAVLSRSPRVKRVALLATMSTINNGAYHAILNGHNVQVTDFDCSSFVPYIERCETKTKACLDTVKSCLNRLPNAKADVVILGCTHFPLLRDIISDYCNGLDIVECRCYLPDNIFTVQSNNNTVYLTTGNAVSANKAAAWYGKADFSHISL